MTVKSPTTEANKKNKNIDLSQNHLMAGIFESLPTALITVTLEGYIAEANAAAEAFFELGRQLLIGQKIDRLLPFGSPLITLIEQVHERGAPINEYKIEIGRPGQDLDRRVDVHCAPLPDLDGRVIVMLQERTIADKIDRQLNHRNAVRSVSGMASMLAHEIKNPLGAIKGAAELLKEQEPHSSNEFLQIIVDETQRLSNVVTEFLDYAKPRKFHSYGSCDPIQVIDHTAQMALKGSKVAFEIETEEKNPHIEADPEVLKQILLNLFLSLSIYSFYHYIFLINIGV